MKTVRHVQTHDEPVVNFWVLSVLTSVINKFVNTFHGLMQNAFPVSAIVEIFSLEMSRNEIAEKICVDTRRRNEKFRQTHCLI